MVIGGYIHLNGSMYKNVHKCVYFSKRTVNTKQTFMFDTLDILLKVTVQFIYINFSSTHQIQYSYFYDQHSQ